MGKLTAVRVKAAAPGTHEDGQGLRLVVSPKGRRSWVLRYTFNGKRRDMGLGPYPIVTLAEARQRALDAHRSQMPLRIMSLPTAKDERP